MTKKLLVTALSLFAVRPGLPQIQVERSADRPSTATTSCQEPYRWYPELCLDHIPFHTSSGPWGPQQAIEAPDAPITTRHVSVDTVEEFERAAERPGTQITVNANLGDVQLAPNGGTLSDIDVVIPAEVRIDRLTVGWFNPPAEVTRFRVRGPTVGQYSGGSVGPLKFQGNQQDIIVDGIGISGEHPDGAGQPMFYPARETHRLAVVNVCAHTGQLFSLGGGGHSVYAGNNVASGANPDPGGGTARWTIRAGHPGPVVVYASRLESLSKDGEPSYHRFRQSPRPDSAHMYVWLSDNIYVDRSESRGVWGNRIGGNDPTDKLTAMWAINSDAYLTGGSRGQSLEGYSMPAVQNYVRATGVNFYGSITLDDQQRNERSTEARDADLTTDTTYNQWREPPAWDTPCDPTKLPL
jgi:hypothetical protein